MSYAQQVIKDLQGYTNPEKAEFFPRFFKTKPGEYGAGDQFIGVKVPDLRKVAKVYYSDIPLEDVSQLLQSPIHEYRLTALFILVYKFEKLKTKQQQTEIVDFYLIHLPYINNWDLVDSSADKILGAYLFEQEKDLLYRLAQGGNLWEQRISIIATFYFIRRNEFADTLKLAKLLLRHKHDLIHKAVGWMLREIGNRDIEAEYMFLKEHYHEMPRTMLRYAIEKFEPELRSKFLNGEV